MLSFYKNSAILLNKLDTADLVAELRSRKRAYRISLSNDIWHATEQALECLDEMSVAMRRGDIRHADIVADRLRGWLEDIMDIPAC